MMRPGVVAILDDDDHEPGVRSSVVMRPMKKEQKEQKKEKK